MAYNYDAAKQAWESMNDQQKKQYTEQNKNDANFQQFAQQYHNENYSTGNSNSDVNQGQGTNTPPSNTDGSNFNNDNGGNGGFSNNNNNNNNNNYGNQGGSPLSDGKNGNGNFYGNTQFDQEEQLDKSMFQQGTGVKVEQGTAKDTGRPDYQLDSDARLAEMTNNLNTYWQTNPEYFSNRETFNKVFEYNQRESDAQRALLDSYWKKKKDMDTASNYNSGDSIYGGLNNAEITPDVFSLIKQMNPEAYQQYQKMLKDEQDKAIANLKFTGAEPLDVTLTNIINKLGIQPGDPHKIRQTFEDRLTELNVWQDSEQLRVLGNNIAGLMSAMNNNAQSLSSQLEGRYSAGYIDARINKANANLQRQANTMLTSYSTLLQGRQQNIALAYQSAQVEQMQAQEDERIFNDKIKALGFAMEYNSYRTPEQKLALQLEEQQIKNNMELLQKSQENDLALYNKYATAKLENQLEYELSDLNVSDPAQLRANLKKVLDSYYEAYGDIIQRPEQQVIDDVINLANSTGMSVAEALKQNFTEPLMNKGEYQQAIADKYGMNPTQSIQNIGDKVALVTKYPNGMMSYQILDDVYNPKYDIKTINGRSYLVVDDGKGVPQMKYIGGNGSVLNYASLNQGLQSFMAKYEEGEFYKQKGCGYFVNEYLTDIGDSGHVGSRWEDKKALCKNKDWENLVIGSVVAIDSGATYQDDNGNTVNAGHVSIVADYDPETGNVLLYDANAKKDGKVHYWESNIKNLYGYYTPEIYKNAGSNSPEYLNDVNQYGFVDGMEGVYGKYLAGDINVQKRIDALGGDAVITRQINNWLTYLQTKGLNKDGYNEDAIDLYEEFLRNGEMPASRITRVLGGDQMFMQQAQNFGKATGFGRYTKLNEYGYSDDLIPLYREYNNTGKEPTEAQVADYGGLDDFNRQAKAYNAHNGITFSPEDQVKEITDMRDKWETSQENKDMLDSIDALAKIQTMLKNGTSGYGDYTAVYLLNKLRDPDSVVREQEFTNTKNIGSIWDSIGNYFQQIDSGKILNDKQKQQVYNEVATLMKAKTEVYNHYLQSYRNKAIKGGDTSKIGTMYNISTKGNISFGGLTNDNDNIPHLEELE